MSNQMLLTSVGILEKEEENVVAERDNETIIQVKTLCIVNLETNLLTTLSQKT